MLPVSKKCEATCGAGGLGNRFREHMVPWGVPNMLQGCRPSLEKCHTADTASDGVLLCVVCAGLQMSSKCATEDECELSAVILWSMKRSCNGYRAVVQQGRRGELVS